MKRLFYIYFVVFTLLYFKVHCNVFPPTIHVFGDSHSYEFIQIPGCKIHWLGPVTMHRVGRDQLSCLNVSAHEVMEGQIAIFAFGEIDVRFHVIKQRDIFGRSLDEIITTLADRYLETILLNRSLYEDLTCIVYSITPPTDNYFTEYRYGALEERIYITKLLNQKLSDLCKIFHIHFLDVYDDYANADGSLNLTLSDGTLHIHTSCYESISLRLNKILLDLNKL